MNTIKASWEWQFFLTEDAQIRIVTTVEAPELKIIWSSQSTCSRKESYKLAHAVLLAREDNVEVIEKLLAEARRMRDEGGER